MNVVMVYHRIPYPPNKGEKMRAWQQLRHVARRHAVWLACFVDRAEDWEHVAFLEQCCREVVAVPLERRGAMARGALGLLGGRCLTDGFYGSKAMHKALAALARLHTFDVAFAFSSSMGRYIEAFPARRRVLDMNDFDSRKWAGYAERSAWPLSGLYRTEARRLAARERTLIARCDLTLMVNGRERDRCDDPRLTERIATLETPMDLGHYAQIHDVPRDKVVGYVGTLDYSPNVEAVMWFAERVWPQVQRRHGDARWWIIGRRPPRAVQCLANRPGVRVTGEVEDILPWLGRLRVFGAAARTDIGVQTKVLEALAAGRPTVITQNGHRGIGAVAGRDYEVAADAPAFATAVSELLDDHDRCRRLSAAAISYVRGHHDVAVVMPRFERMLLGDHVGAEVAV